MSSGRHALKGFLGYVVAAGSREHVQQQPLLELRTAPKPHCSG